jgi:hypothetical protein
MLGVLGSAGTAICLAPCGSALGESNLGQAINAVTGTRLLSFLFLERFSVVLPFCFVPRPQPSFGAHPQVMQQHRQGTQPFCEAPLGEPAENPRGSEDLRKEHPVPFVC